MREYVALSQDAATVGGNELDTCCHPALSAEARTR
jgi:hypothetical protein